MASFFKLLKDHKILNFKFFVIGICLLFMSQLLPIETALLNTTDLQDHQEKL